MATEEITLRSYNKRIDRSRIEKLEQKCEVGPSENTYIFTDTLGEPVCRIRNSPQYKMLVAELNNELVGVIQGTIKKATINCPEESQARVGYILGLRVSPLHRRKYIGSTLVRTLEQWFIANDVDFAYMATGKDNEASVKLFTDKLGFVKLRTPAILINPVRYHPLHISREVEIKKLDIEQAENLYRRCLGSTDFFPDDIDRILKNKLSLGTWVAYPRGESWDSEFESNGRFPTSWAILSVWNTGDLFKLRVGKSSLSCLLYTKILRLLDGVFPWLKISILPDVFHPFGFYFMYGVHCEGRKSKALVHGLCIFVHNMATKCSDCKVIATEVGECDVLREHIPHSRYLSRAEDLWCIKAMKNDQKNTLIKIIRTPPPVSLFVDPREV